MVKTGVAKKDNKVLIIGLLIIFIIALFVMNFGRFTGSATKEKPTTIVKVEPNVIKAGEYINIDLVPGTKGTYNQYGICTADSDLCLAKPRFFCGAFKCLKKISETQKSWASWEPGIYYVKVFDYGSEQYVKGYFTIE